MNVPCQSFRPSVGSFFRGMCDFLAFVYVVRKECVISKTGGIFRKIFLLNNFLTPVFQELTKL